MFAFGHSIPQLCFAFGHSICQLCLPLAMVQAMRVAATFVARFAAGDTPDGTHLPADDGLAGGLGEGGQEE
jgi:hypothetical protein